MLSKVDGKLIEKFRQQVIWARESPRGSLTKIDALDLAVSLAEDIIKEVLELEEWLEENWPP